VTKSGRGPLFRVSALWEGLPGNLDAAVYSPRTQWIHFFKGKGVSYVVLHGDGLVIGKP
jgi:matrix metalloproteinase-19 (RASI)